MRGRGAASMTLEILHGTLMLFGSRTSRKRAEVAAADGLGVYFARIEPITDRWNKEDRRDRRRLYDLYPPHADAFGARREPNRVDRRHRRILDHLRHGVTPETVALGGRRIGEHRQMRRGVVQAGELEAGIRGRSLLILRRQRLGVAALEILPAGGAIGGIVDNEEAPGLTQPHRGGRT